MTNNQTTGIYFANSDNSKTLNINNSKITNNNGQNGGGVYFQESCVAVAEQNSMYIKNTEISGNTSTNGGGIYNMCGHVDLENVTLSENNATSSGGGIYTTYPFIPDPGYNAYIGQAIPTTFTEIRNSTISGNSATVSGGVFVDTNRPVAATVPYTFDMLNTTIANNSSGIGFYDTATNESNSNPINVRLRNNLLVGNGSQNCTFENSTSSNGDEVVLQDTGLGSTFNGNNNLSSDETCEVLSSFGENSTLPQFLGPLQNNGNIVKTHALLKGSVAIDAGENSSCPTLDQRLIARPNGNRCDVGSFEFVPNIRPVTGILFIDSNKNNTKDLADITLRNVTIEILNSKNEVVKTFTTDDNGGFSIELEAGTYNYRIDLNSINLSEELRSAILAFGLIQNFVVNEQGTTFIQIPLTTNFDDVSNNNSTRLIRTGGAL